ncbi:Oidioi.mRNA.OKI2018_I69.chr1.g473.t1.cds [Oikopleura dioica]|uniref:Oidioi.mRNA.OKI2018_I69.chr1.g473.t1.cds n=1 Tax=Oikopleura dioica TaxID=34765 RepID=A0ABN7SLM7_OIKDI|nr:Oidioi.mRNA.OKI2018_I69.chr1.g473.t1.cds [Oikopleura dioica]
MKLFTMISASQAALTSYKAADGVVRDITEGCPQMWPHNKDLNTNIPAWYRQCPPLDLCYPNAAYNRFDSPNARCKDSSGNKVNLESCCSDGHNKFSTCYSACAAGFASNLDGKDKVEYICRCNQNKGCFWQLQGNGLNDLTCNECNGVRRIDWNTSGKKQADFLGMKVPKAWMERSCPLLQAENVMVWNYDLEGVYSEGFGANQWYTFANTIIVLKPNADSPQGPFTTGEVTNILIGLENINDSMWTQDNIDNKIVEYFVGYVSGSAFQGVPYVFDCINSHFGSDPRNNDQSLTDFLPTTL